jgi:hypothetical protein
MSRLAWSLWAAATVMAALGIVMTVVADAPLDMVDGWALTLITATIGALMVARVPRNPIAWILLGVGLLGGLRILATGSADLVLLAGYGARGVGEASAWLSFLLFWPTIVVPVTFVLLLFPDGRLPSPRWRFVAWSAAVSLSALAALAAFAPDVENPRWRENPFALNGDSPVLVVLEVISSITVFPALFGAAASLIVRSRRAKDVERQQLKWVAYGGATAVLLLVLLLQVPDSEADPLQAVMVQVGFVGALAMVPASIAIAILRYRLYDIDRIISRTVSYTLLSGVLVSIYVAGVLLLSRALASVGAGSDLAVAVATLAAAAVFQPARRRIQNAVDRRFNRRRYDAQRTVDAFSSRLQNEFDLDALGSELVHVAAKTMEPATLSLWLRDPAGGR